MRCSDRTSDADRADRASYVQLVLADGRLPTGAHTQSAGVEPAFRAGMPLRQVPELITARLRTVTETEAATAVVTRAVWLGSNVPARPAAIESVDRAWRARTPSDAMRSSSDALGRGYARLAAAVWGLDLGGRVLCRAVVMGATAAAAGLGPADIARLVAFDDVQMVIAAALKLEPFDPLLGVQWSLAAAAEVDCMVRRISNACTPADIPAHSAPLLEQWAQQHATEERRLYRA
ncbi:MAG: Urease accessory protein UreF-like protein [Propionibacteriaceae bacterium]|nr:Urease accessory protein UreF-like protein [Propionibacteriaceae bacterium]